VPLPRYPPPSRPRILRRVSTTWQVTLKPSFLHELNALDKLDVAQVTKKLDLLTQDPRPDAKVKKQLKHLGGKLHRLRAGDLRVFYTFDEPWISLLSVKKRDEKTYDDEVEPDFLGGPEAEEASPATGAGGPARSWEAWLQPAATQGKPLPRAIDDVLLESLGVPKPFRAVLLTVATEEQLIEAPVPQDVLLKVMDVALGRPAAELERQPDLIVNDANDLLRFKDGDLLGFLLRLNPEQEKLVAWGAKSRHPTLLRGGPGTGKSTVALHRTRAMLEALRGKGVASPKILFTTYTRALTRVSEQLLKHLLGADASLVEVRTADATIRELAPGEFTTPSDKDTEAALTAAVEKAALRGNTLFVAAQREALKKLGPAFLLEEIQKVIEARGLASLEAYEAAPRPGRRTPLNKTQRQAVWRAYEAYGAELVRRRKVTWEQLRARALSRVRSGEVAPRYDGLIIDEAQDLPPTTLAALVGLAKSRGGIFLAADANQSIYGSSFRWKDVHQDLTFQGSTAILRANHRSTREIGEAADAYLAAGAEGSTLDDERPAPRYVHEGPLPAVRAVTTLDDEVKLLARFFRGAARDLRQGLGACAALVPTNQAALQIADDLRALGLAAEKVDPKDLDLTSPGVKVMTHRSAKGLEFPIVALAGFIGAPEPHEEALGEARRAVFVAMTRAMRALLVVIPAKATSKLLSGFDPSKWNTGA
jgi:superfamily I DNA/RNA helicase/mRNA-degrading endonuclease RelE of RelBE toxin-antitoxin system